MTNETNMTNEILRILLSRYSVKLAPPFVGDSAGKGRVSSQGTLYATYAYLGEQDNFLDDFVDFLSDRDGDTFELAAMPECSADRIRIRFCIYSSSDINVPERVCG